MNSASQQSQPSFATTRWSIVAFAVDADPAIPSKALDQLGRDYRYPVYAFARCCGHPPSIAMDIVQSFLLALPQRLDRLGPKQMRKQQFRQFLLDQLHAFLAHTWHETGDIVPIDGAPESQGFEMRYQRDCAGQRSPEDAFQRGFALEVIARALDRLRAEAEQAGHADMYESLLPYLGREPAAGKYEEIARSLEKRPLAVAIALKRLRQRLREITNLEVADTVFSAAELDEEERTLLNLLQTRT